LTDAFIKTTELIADKQREMGFEVTYRDRQGGPGAGGKRMKADYGDILKDLAEQRQK
jgi:hypothetical protein